VLTRHDVFASMGGASGDAWYQAFDIKPGDKLYLSPDQRVTIW
jgi:predicted metalloendopeptidase